VVDAYKSLWIATHGGLYRRWPDGQVARYTHSDGLPDDTLHDLLLDQEGQLWVASRNAGLFQIKFDATHAAPVLAFRVTPHDFLQSEWINQLFERSDHTMWAATARGLLEIKSHGDPPDRIYRIYTPENGLTDQNISTLAEDQGGNLWLGSQNGTGLMKLSHNGFITYGEQDGVKRVDAIFPDRAGGVCFRGYVLGDKHASVFDGGSVNLLNPSQANLWRRFARFDGQRLTWFIPDALRNLSLGSVDEAVTLQASNGEWWVGSGPIHFPAADDFTQLKRVRPLGSLFEDPIIARRQVWRLFEDSHDRIWMSLFDSTGNGLAIWERDTQKVRNLTDAANLPSFHSDLAHSFVEDGTGNIWIGFGTGLARFRDDAFTLFSGQDGLPAGAINSIYVDRKGRLWLASARGGLIRVDNPSADRPVFATYTTAQGLSSNVISTITEDVYGRIYVSTGQGLDRLDPATGSVRHYTTADGLAVGNILAAFSAADGWLWFGTTQGLSRFLPEPEALSTPPPVLLTGVRVAGAAQNISALGEKELQLPDLSANATQLQIDFVGLGFVPGESLRYQYMLEGVDHDWSVPGPQRTVTYARLSSGHYNFLVRAVNTDGLVSAAPAVISFRVLPPLYLRWWFIAMVLLLAGAVTYLLYRYRVGRLLEVANMRTRIATDLHDDIGANLTRISILSEVAKQQFGNGDEQSRNPLTSIADIARESVTSMSDIVWAINPERDNLRDLVRKMRQHADEVFTLRDIDLEFHAPGPDHDLKLDVNVRRDLLLIFKEAVSNAARHSDCSRVVIDFKAEHHRLWLRIADNGSGFDAGSESSGHGLTNMVRRAKNLGGELQIDSNRGHGTTVSVEIPLPRARLRA
jgi:two-component sensor histidine kinase/streptogramin lyase